MKRSSWMTTAAAWSAAIGMLVTAAWAADAQPAAAAATEKAENAVIQFLTPPYLQNCTATGIVVMCELPRPTRLRLEYGRRRDYGTTAGFEFTRIAPNA